MVSASTYASDIEFTSDANPPQLVELYTSEGCSSCPPADQFLSGLSERPDLYHTLFPMAFHVDYWNHLGWKDRFSQVRFSQRQHRLASLGYLSQVYTPGFVVNGREWRAWFAGARQLPAPPTTGKAEASAFTLKVIVSGDELTLLTTDMPTDATESRPNGYRLNLALTLSDQETEVSRGENRGRQLHHDFVVVGLDSWPLTAQRTVNWKALANQEGLMPLSDRAKPAIVAWISSPTQQPLRAAGGYLTQN